MCRDIKIKLPGSISSDLAHNIKGSAAGIATDNHIFQTIYRPTLFISYLLIYTWGCHYTFDQIHFVE